jgi:folate-binding protein YgfZ
MLRCYDLLMRNCTLNCTLIARSQVKELMSNWSNFIQEHRKAVPSDSGLVPVADDVIVEVAGADAAKLLQGQITADVDQLADGEFSQAALCTNKGRVISVFHILRADQNFFCRLPADNAEPLIATLKKYGVFYKVEVTLREDMGIAVLLQEELPDGLTDKALLLKHGPEAQEYWIEQNQWQDCWTLLTQSGVQDSEHRWKLAKLRMGWSEIFPETGEAFLPHALSLDLSEAISFTKGCYTGQEIVARTHYRGKSKKRLTLLRADVESILPGTDIQSAEGISIGSVVVSAASDSDKGGTEILATAKIDIAEAGELMLDDKLVAYSQISLPWSLDD